MKRWHTYQPRETRRARLRDQLANDTDAIFSYVHPYSDLLVYFRKKIYSLADVMRRNRYNWDLTEMNAALFFAKRHEEPPPRGVSIEQVYLASINYDELEYLLSHVLDQARANEADRLLVGNMLFDDRDKRKPDCLGRSPDTWVQAYLLEDYTSNLRYVNEYELDEDKVGPYLFSGRDPIHNWGLVHRTPTRDLTEALEDRLVTYVCCGRPRNDPGCWYGEVRGIYVAYDFAPAFRGPEYEEAVLRRDDDTLKQLWAGERPDPTLWQNPGFYRRLDAKIQAKKGEVAPLVVAYLLTRFDDTMPPELLDGLRELVKMQRTFNAVFCLSEETLPAGDAKWAAFLDRTLFAKQPILFELARGVFIPNTDVRLPWKRPLRNRADVMSVIDEVGFSDTNFTNALRLVADEFRTVDAWNLGAWKGVSDMNDYVKFATVVALGKVQEAREARRELRETASDVYDRALNEYEQDRLVPDDFYDLDIETPEIEMPNLKTVTEDLKRGRAVETELGRLRPRRFKEIGISRTELEDLIEIAQALIDKHRPFEMPTGALERVLTQRRQMLDNYKRAAITHDEALARNAIYQGLSLGEYRSQVQLKALAAADALRNATDALVDVSDQRLFKADIALFEFEENRLWEEHKERRRLEEAERLRLEEQVRQMALDEERKLQAAEEQRRLEEDKRLRLEEATKQLALADRQKREEERRLQEAKDKEAQQRKIDAARKKEELAAAEKLRLDEEYNQQLLRAEEARKLYQRDMYDDTDAERDAKKKELIKLGVLVNRSIKPTKRTRWEFSGTEPALLSRANMQFENNSCWVDSAMTALFKVPGLWLEQHILKAKEVQTYAACEQTVAQALHDAIVDDMLYIQDPDVEKDKCSVSRYFWAKCMRQPVKSGAFGDANASIRSILDFYRVPSENVSYNYQEPGAMVESIPLNFGRVGGGFDLVLFFHDTAGANVSFESGSPPAEIEGEYTLTSGIVDVGNHFRAYVRDPVAAQWWLIDIKPSGKPIVEMAGTEVPQALRASQDTNVPVTWVYVPNSQLRDVVDRFRASRTDDPGERPFSNAAAIERRLRAGDTAGLSFPADFDHSTQRLAAAVLDDDFRLRAAASYLATGDRKAAAAAQFEYEIFTPASVGVCVNKLLALLSEIQQGVDSGRFGVGGGGEFVPHLEMCYREITRQKFEKSVLEQVGALYKNGKWATKIAVSDDTDVPNTYYLDGAVWLPSDGSRGWSLAYTYTPKQLPFARVIGYLAYLGIVLETAPSAKEIEDALDDIKSAQSVLSIIQTLNNAKLVSTRNVDNVVLKIPTLTKRESKLLWKAYTGETDVTYVADFVNDKKLPAMLRDVDITNDLLSEKEAFRFQAFIRALILYNETEKLSPAVRKSMAIASIGK